MWGCVVRGGSTGYGDMQGSEGEVVEDEVGSSEVEVGRQEDTQTHIHIHTHTHAHTHTHTHTHKYTHTYTHTHIHTMYHVEAMEEFLVCPTKYVTA